MYIYIDIYIHTCQSSIFNIYIYIFCRIHPQRIVHFMKNPFSRQYSVLSACASYHVRISWRAKFAWSLSGLFQMLHCIGFSIFVLLFCGVLQETDVLQILVCDLPISAVRRTCHMHPPVRRVVIAIFRPCCCRNGPWFPRCLWSDIQCCCSLLCYRGTCDFDFF